MDDEVFESAALQSLDDFEWLAVPNGPPSAEKQPEGTDTAIFEMAVASGRKAKRISPNR